MNLTFGRVRPREELASGTPLASVARRFRSLPRAQITPQEVVEVAARAERILLAAQARADQIVARAEAEFQGLREQAAHEAKAEASAALAAQSLALAAREANADERALDRSVEFARMLAERLLGEALGLDATRVAALARTALAEARGARRIVLVAHPEDVPVLERAIVEGELGHVSHVVASSERPRGALRLESELGVLDAELGPQLDRLARRLRETLRHDG